MRFEILQENLMRVLNIVAPAVGARSDPEQTHGILLSVEGDLLTATATNLAVTISATTKAKVHKAGAVLCPSEGFIKQVDALNPNLPVELTATKTNVTVAAGDAKTVMATRNAEDFPAKPELSEDPECMVFAYDLRSAIHQVSATCLREKFESRPALAGIEMALTESGLRMFSFDGKGSASVSVIPAQVSSIYEPEFDMNIREDALKPLVSALSKNDPKDEVFIYSGKKGRHLGFRCGGVEYITSGQEYRYAGPNVSGFVSDTKANATTHVTVDRRPLLSALRLAKLTNPQVRIRVTENNVALAATAEGGTKHNNTLGQCTTDGPEVNIAFNAEFVAEAVSLMDCKSVTFGFTSGKTTFAVYDAAGEIPWVFALAPLLI